MTISTLPRWEVMYRRAGVLDTETITLQAVDLVAAVRAAREQLTKASRTWPIAKDADAIDIARPFRVTSIHELLEDPLRERVEDSPAGVA